jgi:hypothetical protein
VQVKKTPWASEICEQENGDIGDSRFQVFKRIVTMDQSMRRFRSQHTDKKGQYQGINTEGSDYMPYGEGEYSS